MAYVYEPYGQSCIKSVEVRGMDALNVKPQPEPREAEIPLQLSRVEAVIRGLSEQVARLREKLAPLCSAPGPQAKESGISVSKSTCEVAAILSQRIEEIDAIRSNVSDLLERLEV